MYELEIEIKGLPKLINQLAWEHWTKKKKHNDLWKKNVALAVGLNKPEKPLEKAKLTLTRYSSREPDFDGLVSSWKSLIDSLVICGVLKDDTQKVIGQSEFLWEKTSPKNGRVRIKIMEVDGE